MVQSISYAERRKRSRPVKNPMRRLLGLVGAHEHRPNPYDLNLEVAHIIIMEQEAHRIKRDPHDEEAIQYFCGVEFQRWFDIPSQVMLKLVMDLPADRFSYALKHIKPRSEASQKALDSTF